MASLVAAIALAGSQQKGDLGPADWLAIAVIALLGAVVLFGAYRFLPGGGKVLVQFLVGAVLAAVFGLVALVVAVVTWAGST